MFRDPIRKVLWTPSNTQVTLLELQAQVLMVEEMMIFYLLPENILLVTLGHNNGQCRSLGANKQFNWVFKMLMSVKPSTNKFINLLFSQQGKLVNVCQRDHNLPRRLRSFIHEKGHLVVSSIKHRTSTHKGLFHIVWLHKIW